jgi:hypothetical protein
MRTGIAAVGANHFSTNKRKDFSRVFISCSFNFVSVNQLRLFRAPGLCVWFVHD